MALPDNESIGSDRIGFLSDGVVAIAITLLVLDLEVPEVGSSVPELLEKLSENTRSYVVFVFAFWLIAQYWKGHRSLLARIERAGDEVVVWPNFLFLFCIVAIPFSSNLLTANGDNPLAVTIFGANLLLTNAALQVLAYRAYWKGYLHETQQETWLRTRARFYTLIAITCLSILLAWFDASVAELAYLLMVFNEIPGAILERRAQRHRSRAVDPTTPERQTERTDQTRGTP